MKLGILEFCDHHLVIPKLLYFSLNMLCYSTYTFTPLYFQQVWGLESHFFGYIVGLSTLSFTGSLLWTMIADKTGRHKLILILTSIGYCSTFLLLRTHLFTKSEERGRLLFVALCYGVSNFFTSGLYPLLDNRVFVMLSKDKRFSKELYGRQRLFGTLGQSFITLMNGYLIGRWGFDFIFINLTLSTILFVTLVIMGIPPQVSNNNNKNSNGGGGDDGELVVDDDNNNKEKRIPLNDENSKGVIEGAGGFSQSARKLLFTFDFPFFLFIILIAGTTRGVSGNYLPQYFDKVMKLSTWEISIIMQSRLPTEILVFFLGKQMLETVGVHWMLLIGQFTGFLRVFAYALLPNYFPWTLLPLLIELLKGINNACVVSAGARFVHDFAPSGAEATAQGFFSGVHSYLANASSGFFGGLILETYQHDPNSFQILFTITSILSFIGLGLFTIRHLKKLL